jgi:glycosyltransferase involved in cell wall biosynthesis
VLKLHPLEPVHFKNFFFDFAGANSSWMEIADADADIFKLITQSKLIVGFNSASLTEALALNTPCISLSTVSMPNGVYEFLGPDMQKNGIKLVDVNNIDELTTLLNRCMTDQSFYKQWQSDARQMSHELFAENFVANAKTLIRQYSGVN